MSKYMSVFFLTLFASVILYFVLVGLFDGGDYVETAVYTTGAIIILLLSFLIALMFYAINLLKRKI